MAKIDWQRAQADYISNPKMTLDKVAAKYGVSQSLVYIRSAVEQWVEVKKEILRKSEEKLKEKLPETIAQVKLRHIETGRALQGIGLEAIKSGMKPNSFKDARLSILSGVEIEREALGLNDKEVHDEIYQRFQQFTFIFNLKEDELRRFVKSALQRGGYQDSNAGATPAPQNGGGEKTGAVATAPVSG